ncbi:MAG: hypothetical protein JW822_14665 [Spirochaetales bacterium]|nr:hypothetical protein [Spirochaetales bacterium]
MVKKIMLFIALFIIITNFLNMHLLFADRIGDMRDKIEEEKERQEDDDDNDDDSSGGGCLGGGLFSSDDDDDEDYWDDDEDDSDDWQSSDTGDSGSCMLGFFDVFGGVRYASFPYDPNCNYNFVGWADESPDNEKIGYLQVDMEGAYLFEETYGLNAKASVNLSFIRVHCFYQFVFDPVDYFNVFSGNAGFTIPVADGMLHVFAGFYLMDIISYMTFSFGCEFTYFFPSNLIFDVYSLNSFFGELGFHTFSCTVSYAVGNFSFGGGFNYNYYAGITFMRPMLKVTLWI